MPDLDAWRVITRTAYSALPRKLPLHYDCHASSSGRTGGNLRCLLFARVGSAVGRSPLPLLGFDPRGGPEGDPLRGSKKCPPDPPCGAKPRGGGGAPPTGLILLRNQRPARPRRRAAVSPSRTPALAPTTPAPAGLAGRQTLPARHAGHPRDASLHASQGVRLCLAGRQALTSLTALLGRVRHPASRSLRFDRHAHHVRQTRDLRSVHCGR